MFSTTENSTNNRNLIAGIALRILFFLFVLSPVASYSQDTTQYAIQREVEIVDSVLRRFQHSANLTRFEPDSFGQFGVTGITADAVLGQAAGLYVRNYGGHGGVRTISIRGFSTQQTTVSVNGVPYSSPQTGTVNFSDFFPDGYQAIELTESALSPGYNALGGNVNFEIKPTQQAVQLKAGIGNFGERMGRIGWDYHRGKSSFRIGYHSLRADDNYPFSLNGESGTRDHSAFQTQRYQFFYRYQVAPRTEVSYLATGFVNEQEVPGPIVTGNPVNSDGDLSQQDHFFYVRLKHQAARTSGILPVKTHATVRYHYDKLDYQVSNQLQRYVNRDLFAEMDFTHLFGKQSLESSFQYTYTQLTGNNLAINFRPVESADRQQLNAGLTHRLYLGGTDSTQHPWVSAATFRINYLERYGLLPNAGININWQASDRLEVFTHLHYGHRIPAFNELYYFGFGNANLETEKVRSVDVGWLIKGDIGIPASLKFSVFANQTRDKIISVPINPVRWSTFAIGKTQSAGGEVSLELRRDAKNYAYMTYTLQRAQDLTRADQPFLPYTPQELASYGFQMSWDQLEIGANGQFSGWRYSLLQNDAGSFLPSYHVLNLQAGYLIPTRWFTYKLILQAENVLNANYEVIRSYPMPPASYRIVLLLHF